MKINHREAFGFWLNRLRLTNTGAEIGCASGAFAATVLSQWTGQLYHMIDPWEVQDKEIYKENQPETYTEWYEACVELARQDSRIILHREYSHKAAGLFGSSSLDWAYIDGNHAYGAVLSDMDHWWPKIRLGGIMGGHDFYTRTEGGAWVEVEAAVKRWATEHNVTFSVTPCTSWWIEKTHA